MLAIKTNTAYFYRSTREQYDSFKRLDKYINKIQIAGGLKDVNPDGRITRCKVQIQLGYRHGDAVEITLKNKFLPSSTFGTT